MNVYDFDHTIYDGDSTKDFFKYCLRKHPILVMYLPRQIIAFVTYKLGLISKLEFKQKFYGFLNFIELPEKQVEDFWGENKSKIKPWYVQQKKENDVIISASPEFLLKPICEQMDIKYLIASLVDIKTGQCLSENCFGKEKVRRFNAYFGEICINEIYSDSLTDIPLALLAQKSFFVKKNTILPWEFENGE